MLINLMRGLFLLVLILLVACSHRAISVEPSSTPKSPGETGIEGVISIGPIRGGPTREGVPDSKPLANTDFKVEKQGSTVLSFTTDEKGRFHISLPAGHYTVTRKSESGGIGKYSFEVDVTAGQMKQVQWECDSGIR